MGAFLQGDQSELALISFQGCFHGSGCANILPGSGSLGLIAKCVALLLKAD